MKCCFIVSFVCSEQQPNQRTGDLPMTTTYESIDPSTPPGVVYASVEEPVLNGLAAEPGSPEYEIVDAAVPVNGDYLTPNPLYTTC